MASRAQVLALLALGWGCLGSAPAWPQEFTREVQTLTREYARTSGQCQMHAPSSTVAQAACPQVAQYEKRLTQLGWEPQQAKKRLFDGCSRFGSAYQLAGISRDTRQPPEAAFKRLLADKTLRIKEPALKSIVNTAYFEDWAIRLSPLELAQTAGDACRYGDDPTWQPLK